MTTAGATNATSCACKPGFLPAPTADGSPSCADIDECDLRLDSCDAHATCLNLPGAYACRCDPGYAGDGFLCVPVDECAAGVADCDPHAACFDTPGSFLCACRRGYVDAGPPGAPPGVRCAVDNRLRATGGEAGSVGPTLGPPGTGGPGRRRPGRGTPEVRWTPPRT